MQHGLACPSSGVMTSIISPRVAQVGREWSRECRPRAQPAPTSDKCCTVLHVNSLEAANSRPTIGAGLLPISMSHTRIHASSAIRSRCQDAEKKKNHE
ncbi:hypothetical protein B296_00010498 [Ensete ventricosum]|uniref:Uncharacterized protein n=1 Tax=Ensete ventricosum TaxID=4639 RepID=A0A427BA45_ENSVE|nr:hypothetical protein B296_00010498 [Ensete ventricosum]